MRTTVPFNKCGFHMWITHISAGQRIDAARRNAPIVHISAPIHSRVIRETSVKHCRVVRSNRPRQCANTYRGLTDHTATDRRLP